MAGEDGSGEKTHDPTPKKLGDARKKGDIAKSNDLTVAMIYLAFLIAILATGGSAIASAASKLTMFLSSPDLLLGKILGSGGCSCPAPLLHQSSRPSPRFSLYLLQPLFCLYSANRPSSSPPANYPRSLTGFPPSRAPKTNSAPRGWWNSPRPSSKC